MSALRFTNRELVRAWRELKAEVTPANNQSRKNPHRLLMFYAVECGLKAVWLKRRNRDLFDEADIKRTGHNLRDLLKELNVGSDLSLPNDFQLEKPMRRGQFGEIHQAWRYGGRTISPADQDCEQQMQQVLDWIEGELK
ncbi:hypothetical protein RAE19_15620 [Rhodoferax sp. TBRC 17660]|uniref:HEPN domain-containing protein n=1 Tax=Rhodoferax potami TaxID=3068338 RepID=A0ABU3KR87_9BURK|nr:hypothetical protein [Rhodoferax sp. TBRC 17660]MDT7520118.1 hypothetical protein [Rhodoferax sp. TBRC 17660]